MTYDLEMSSHSVQGLVFVVLRLYFSVEVGVFENNFQGNTTIMVKCLYIICYLHTCRLQSSVKETHANYIDSLRLILRMKWIKIYEIH